MKIHSLYTKIKLIFIVLTLLLTALFAAYFFISMGKEMMQTQHRYMGTMKLLHQYYRQNQSIDIDTLIEHNQLKIIRDETVQEKVLTKGTEVQRNHMPPTRKRFKVLTLGKHYYLHINHRGLEVLLEDTEPPTPPFHLIGWYVLALFLVILFYFWITKSLKPLKELQQQIRQVGDGDLSLSLKRDEKDEIAEVANEFDNALRKIEALINSRQLFLRTIMHELKTPIAKGRIVTEMLDEPIAQNQYETIFERLELLIEEFSKVEQMLSLHYNFTMANYNIQDILDQAIELLIMDEEKVEEQITITQKESFRLHTDFNFLALALKNLIDNALKYSPDTHVTIEISDHQIAIINQGEALSNDIESFFKPFHNQTDMTNGGLGLGLYIVKSITDKLSLKFTHNYINEEHHFIIEA